MVNNEKGKGGREGRTEGSEDRQKDTLVQARNSRDMWRHTKVLQTSSGR